MMRPLILFTMMVQGADVPWSDPEGAFVIRSAATYSVKLNTDATRSFRLDGHCRVEQNDKGMVLLSNHIDGVAAQQKDGSSNLQKGNATGDVDLTVDSAKAAQFNKTPPDPAKGTSRMELTSQAISMDTDGASQAVTLPDPFKATEHRTSIGKADGAPFTEDMDATASSGKLFYLPAIGKTPAQLQTGEFQGPVHIHIVNTSSPSGKPLVTSEYDVTGDHLTFDFTKTPGQVVITGNVHYVTTGAMAGTGKADTVTISTDAGFNPIEVDAHGQPAESNLHFPGAGH